MGKMLLEFPHENAGLEALHLHEESKQLKKGLPFAFSKLPKQNFFQEIKRLMWFIADINCVQNVLKDSLGRAAQSIGIPELLRFDARRGELRLDEAEPYGQFLLIVGAKLDLRGCLLCTFYAAPSGVAYSFCYEVVLWLCNKLK
jgi:hypothetical protein